jgi:hypothetical protein
VIDWLLKLDPREAQLEALSRSYLGVATRDRLDDTPFSRPVPGHRQDQPALSWAHFMEQRVGKTPTNLNEFALLRRDFGVKWNIVLAPNAFKKDWPLEAEKFGLDAPATFLESSKRDQLARWISKNEKHGGLIAVNYEALVQKDTVKLLKSLPGRQTMITADESVKLKNITGAFAKGGIEIAKECVVRRDLSGKPIVQGPHDLLAQLRFIGVANGVDPTVWKNRYCVMGGHMGKQVTGIKNEESLHALLDTCSWNARKIDWLKTPGKDYAPLRVFDMLPDQAAMYRSMQKEFLVELVSGEIVSADQVITKLIKLQQIASGYIIDEMSETQVLVDPARNPKLQMLKNMLQEEIRLEQENGKVILICVSKYMLDLLERELAEYQPAVIRGQDWHKKTGRDIVAEKARYNGDPKCRLMIGQEQAIKYGHTLMGDSEQPCLNQIYVENSYSLDDRSQSEERAQGVGQQAPITIWDFVVSEQDMRVIEALQRKEDIASVALRYARETGVLPRGIDKAQTA